MNAKRARWLRGMGSEKGYKARKKLWSRMSRPEREKVIAIEEART